MRPEEILSKFRGYIGKDKDEVSDEELWKLIYEWAESEWWLHGYWKFMGGR